MYLNKNDSKIIPFPFVRIFLLIYIVFNLIGLINFPFYKSELYDNSNIYLFIVGLLGSIFGVISFRKLKLLNNSSYEAKNRSKNIFTLLAIIFSLALFFIILTNVLSGGVIVLSGDKRFASFAVTNLLVYSSIVMTHVYFSNRLLRNKKITWLNLFFLIFLSLLIISLGYRSPIITLLGGFFVIFYSIRNKFQNDLKKIFSFKILVSAFTFLIIMSYIASFRVSLKWDIDKFYKNIDNEVINENTYLRPLVPIVSLFRYDQEVVGKLISETKDNYMYLGFAISNILTILPGEQLGARNIVGEIINAREAPSGKPWSITPTLQGAFFIDGGYIFTFIGFYLTTSFMEILRKVIKFKRDPFYFALYGLMVVAFLKSIHTGYFDVSMYIIILMLFILRFLCFKIKYNFKPL